MEALGVSLLQGAGRVVFPCTANGVSSEEPPSRSWAPEQPLLGLPRGRAPHRATGQTGQTLGSTAQHLAPLGGSLSQWYPRLITEAGATFSPHEHDPTTKYGDFLCVQLTAQGEGAWWEPREQITHLSRDHRRHSGAGEGDRRRRGVSPRYRAQSAVAQNELVKTFHFRCSEHVVASVAGVASPR